MSGRYLSVTGLFILLGDVGEETSCLRKCDDNLARLVRIVPDVSARARTDTTVLGSLCMYGALIF